MTSLLKTEWLKLKKYWAFWLMTGIVALTYPGINYMMYTEAYKDNLNDKKDGTNAENDSGILLHFRMYGIQFPLFLPSFYFCRLLL